MLIKKGHPMKKIHFLLFLISTFSSTLLPQSLLLTPDNTAFALDIDGVILTLPKSQWPFIVYKSAELIQSAQDAQDLSKTLWYMSGMKGMRDEDGNKIDGLTAQMITLGMQHKEATRFIAPMLDIIEDARQLDQEMVKIIKDAHLPTIYATNKDILTYQRAVNKHNLKHLAIQAIVTKHPLSPKVLEYAQLSDTPESYRLLVNEYHNAQETDNIKIASDKKPSLKYYELVEKVIGCEKNIIHPDDTKKNTDAFNTLNSDSAQRIGVHYQGNPEQLKDLLTELGLRTS